MSGLARDVVVNVAANLLAGAVFYIAAVWVGLVRPPDLFAATVVFGCIAASLVAVLVVSAAEFGWLSLVLKAQAELLIGYALALLGAGGLIWRTVLESKLPQIFPLPFKLAFSLAMCMTFALGVLAVRRYGIAYRKAVCTARVERRRAIYNSRVGRTRASRQPRILRRRPAPRSARSLPQLDGRGEPQ